jgi:hypothetical protein
MPYLEELNPAFETKAGRWSLLVGPSSLNTRLLQGIAYLSSQAPAGQLQVTAFTKSENSGRPTPRRGENCKVGGKPPNFSTYSVPAIAPQVHVPAIVPQVHVLDGGNRFNGYTLARAARGRTEVLNRITVARAFTCHQMLALLESTPASDGPFIILDLLRTFYDESVQAGERKRLLRGCITQMQRLEQAGGGLASVHPPALPSPAAVELLGMLQAAAADTFFVHPAPGVALPEQMRLF